MQFTKEQANALFDIFSQKGLMANSDHAATARKDFVEDAIQEYGIETYSFDTRSGSTIRANFHEYAGCPVTLFAETLSETDKENRLMDNLHEGIIEFTESYGF